MPDIRKHILRSLAYFDLFQYPLTLSEIYLFLGVRCNQSDVHSHLNDMLNDHLIYQFDGFYSLRDEVKLIERRKKGNQKAEQMIVSARIVGRILARFPFVKGIAISGSLSKHFADDESDIDLFIITSSNRLWIARTLMHIMKKLSYLFRKQHWFCMNYYIDEEQLIIEEKNLYTATEIVTLIPLYHDGIFDKFYKDNVWANKYFPNRIGNAETKLGGRFFLKVLFEKLFDNEAGVLLDKRLEKITRKRWEKKTKLKCLNDKGSILAMNCSRHCAKPLSGIYNGRLVEACHSKVEGILKSMHELPAL